MSDMNYQGANGKPEPVKGSSGAGYSRGTMSGVAFASGTLVDGNAVVVAMAGAPMPGSVWVRPAAGDAVSVWYTHDGTNYEVWAKGAVTAFAEAALIAPVLALKFQRTAGSGTTSTYGVN